MTGSNKGTLIGIFPKLSISLVQMGEDDFNTILKLTDQGTPRISLEEKKKKKKQTKEWRR